MSEVPNRNVNKLDDKGNLFPSPLTSALKKAGRDPYDAKAQINLSEEIEKTCGKALVDLKTLDELLNSKVMKSIAALTSKGYAEDVKKILTFRTKCQFSDSVYRKSYRSNDFGYYAYFMVRKIAELVRFTMYEYTVMELFSYDTSYIPAFTDIVALEINKGNKEIIDAIKEMILGDNNILLSRQVIRAIIISDNEELKALLMDLLLAAKMQEGVRQAILESADEGSIETFKMIFRISIENDLFRFSSAARALYTWTGLYVEVIDIKEVGKIAKTAYECLTDESKRAEYFNSKNPIEVYLSMWGMGCYEVQDTDRTVERLLESKEKYLRMLAWYFVYRVENGKYRHKLAVKYLNADEDMDLIGLITDNLHYNNQAMKGYWRKSDEIEIKSYPDAIYPSEYAERRKLFYTLKTIAEKIGNKEWVYKGYLFPWSDLVVNNENANVLNCMYSLAVYDLSEELIDELFKLKDFMSVDLRRYFYLNLLDPKNSKQREYLYEALRDRSPGNREVALRKLAQCKVSIEDIAHICEQLVTKSSSLKKTFMNFLNDRSYELREYAAGLLIKGKETQIQAAIELMLGDEKIAGKYSEDIKELKNKKLSDQTKLLLDQLEPEVKETDELTPENGYGLYDIAVCDKEMNEFLKLDYPVFSKQEMRAFDVDIKEMEKLFEKINDVFVRHADYEYKYIDYTGTKVTTLFGNSEINIPIPEEYHPGSNMTARWERLHMVPFHEEFEEILKPYFDNPIKYAALLHTVSRNSSYNTHKERAQLWFLPYVTKYSYTLNYADYTKVYGSYRFSQIREIIEYGSRSMDQDVMFRIFFSLYMHMVNEVGIKNMPKIAINKGSNSWQGDLPAISADIFVLVKAQLSAFTPSLELKKLWAKVEWAIERFCGFKENAYFIFDYLADLKDKDEISDDSLYEWLLNENTRSGGEISRMTNLSISYGKSYLEKHPWIDAFAGKLVRNMILFESKRGQSATPISSKMNSISKYYGKEYFVLLLKALGSENFFRGYRYSADTKNTTLSLLLRRCYPAKDDTAESLKNLLKDTDIKEKRLIEAAMYAPQWAPFIETITGWTGLKKAVWFFHAHVSESFSSDKETEVAVYSPISPIKFNDGAFDIEWFWDSYNTLGEKRFNVLYKCAKYITEGSNSHRRSQLYVDAATGKFKVSELEEVILDKRNQERIKAYALIPIEKDDDKELLRRYEFICKYIKTSKQFGALRRDSEKKAGNMALENLAVACGLFDVNRMLWRLERVKTEEIKPYTKGKEIEGYTLALSFDEDGNPFISYSKDGKELKSLPKAIAKDEYTEELKQTVKELKDQKSRSRGTLENAMINRTRFTVSEIENILDSYTIAPMVSKLLFTDGESIGFIRKNEYKIYLFDFDNKEKEISKDSTLLVAHPYNMMEKGVWSSYMHFAYENMLVQPFKQIFREYYPVSSEEKEEKNISRRFAGYQVQTKKAVALFKSRGWTVDYEEGLQKVFYEDNLIVRMYALADWFSPADVEAPTLEQVVIINRETESLVDFEAVSPVLFSEIMRDIDLVVSVACVGGVDPETSHSTVEMRAAIAKELCLLLKLNNVEFKERHAVIHGSLSDYSVHLGSGVCHAINRGMIPVIPVHSQHRGRVFLPFADEDPKTAEIMSKIILFSEDTKIKDPEILSFLK